MRYAIMIYAHCQRWGVKTADEWAARCEGSQWVLQVFQGRDNRIAVGYGTGLSWLTLEDLCSVQST